MTNSAPTSARDHGCRLLRLFGEAIGIPSLSFDEAGSCCLVFDADILVNIALEERLGRLVLFSYLGNAPDHRQGQALSMLLQGNFFWQGTDGATLAIEGGSRSSVLMRELPLDRLDAALFQEAVERFVNTAEHWIARLRDAGDDGPAPMPALPAIARGMRV